MSYCPFCARLSHPERVFRDRPHEPFVVMNLSYSSPVIPSVVAREHQDQLFDLSTLANALIALKEEACRVYGNHYYIDPVAGSRRRDHIVSTLDGWIKSLMVTVSTESNRSTKTIVERKVLDELILLRVEQATGHWYATARRLTFINEGDNNAR